MDYLFDDVVHQGLEMYLPEFRAPKIEACVCRFMTVALTHLKSNY